MAASPRYVLSERAANALRDLIAPGSTYNSRPRPAHDPQTGGRMRPFACRLAGEEQPRLRVYLPPETAQAVRFRGFVVPPAIRIGTAAEPWRALPLPVDEELYLILSFEEYEKSDGTLDFRAVSWTLGGAVEPDAGATWPHLVCAIEPGLGLVQYHLGSLLVGDPSASPGEEPPPEIPECGNPLNDDPDDDEHPLGGDAGAWHPFPGNNSETDHPLDGEGDGGYTPLCADDTTAEDTP